MSAVKKHATGMLFLCCIQGYSRQPRMRPGKNLAVSLGGRYGTLVQFPILGPGSLWSLIDQQASKARRRSWEGSLVRQHWLRVSLSRTGSRLLGEQPTATRLSAPGHALGAGLFPAHPVIRFAVGPEPLLVF